MILFDPCTTSFNNNGLGHLHPIKCIETKKKSLNGWFIECELPINNKDVILQDYILFVETKEKGGQPFRINNINKTDRKIVVTANHVAFDSERYVLIDVRPTNLSPVSFLDWINKRTETESPFTTTSNVTGSGTKYFIRKTLLDALVETESLFGGNYDVDKFDVSLKSRIGNDDGFSLIYGKNIQSASVIEDWSSVCTRIIPVGPNELMLDTKYIDSDTQYDTPFTRVINFDFETDGMTELKMKEKLRELAIEFLVINSVPRINYLIKSDVNQTLRIGDVIRVKHPITSINTEVQSYTYDTIKKRVLTLEFGNYTRDIKKAFDSIKDNIKDAEEKASGALIESKKQSDLINNLNKNGLVYIDDNEILILDKLPKEEAEQVWRFGLGGIGFSNNGYEGPFEYALTQDGHFNIDFIQANSITVNKLAADVGSSLDLSSNESIKLYVEDVKSVTEKVDKIESNTPITCNYSYSNGIILSDKIADTTHIVRFFYGATEITDLIPEQYFVWKRKSTNAEDDDYWNSQHAEGTKTLHTTKEDLFEQALFTCDVDETVIRNILNERKEEN